MITDSQFQLAPFVTHIPSDGSHVADGAPDPTTFHVFQDGLDTPDALIVMFAGPPNAVCEIGISRPLLPNTGNVKLSFDLLLGADSLHRLQVIETDLKVTQGGKTANLSGQINRVKGIFQASDSGQGWNDTPIKAELVRYVPNHYELEFKIDFHKGVYSYSSLTLNGVTSIFPAAQQNIPIGKTGWADGAIFQFQLALGPQGGSVLAQLSNAQLEWS